jgi:MYXO-CTERM domain-containing protein
MQRFRTVLFLGVALASLPLGASAITVWDEGTNGDLSNDAAAPTPIGVGFGINSIFGSSQAGDRDFFTFTVPDGGSFVSLVLTAFDSTDDLAFLALEAGSVISDITSPANLLGWLHPSATFVGTDVLDDMALGEGALGFASPLGPGTYTLWMQQTHPELVSYAFDLTIEEAVPVSEPPVAAMLILGMAALAFARRRRT